ncbi:C-C motif chemokine 4-like [Erpetoichthys calabaricus]|uniref:C-C motif chemokine 4-like n=1 Tax=Erpetoichthys calabaricus TaxID=27687 RepID=UPI00223494C3|nr:C-C motif chemokine 4-like [Erpetoichthys calabaricus]
MKQCAIAILCLLLWTEFIFASFAPSSLDCCTKISKGVLDENIQKRIKQHYFQKRSVCSRDAVVFITQKNRTICADPNADWVTDLINKLKNPTPTKKIKNNENKGQRSKKKGQRRRKGKNKQKKGKGKSQQKLTTLSSTQ